MVISMDILISKVSVFMDFAIVMYWRSFLFLNVKTVMFLLCTVMRNSIIKLVFLHTFKIYNKEIGKTDESLWRKATGPVKWQPAA